MAWPAVPSERAPGPVRFAPITLKTLLVPKVGDESAVHSSTLAVIVPAVWLIVPAGAASEIRSARAVRLPAIPRLPVVVVRKMSPLPAPAPPAMIPAAPTVKALAST